MERVPGVDELVGDRSNLISNKTYTANVRTKLDLYSESLMRLPQYRPPKGGFPGAVLKLACGTCLLFKSGKVVINGVKSEPDELEFEMVTYIRLYDVKLSHCSGYMKVGKLNLANLKIAGSIFEPELHPGQDSCSRLVKLVSSCIIQGRLYFVDVVVWNMHTMSNVQYWNW